MEIGNYIEYKLKEKKLTKLWLYNNLKNTFHKFDNNYLNYNSFSIKIANNKLKANELIEISYILDINLNQLKRYLINDLNNKKKLNTSKIEDNILEVIFKNSSFNEIYNLNKLEKSQNSTIFDIIEISENVYNFYLYSKEYNIAILELFNFNNETFIKLCSINDLDLFLLENNLIFINLTKLEKKELVALLMKESEEYLLLFPHNIPKEYKLKI